MEESDVTDTGRIVLKGDTTLSLHFLQRIERLEVTIRNGFIRECNREDIVERCRLHVVLLILLAVPFF